MIFLNKKNLLYFLVSFLMFSNFVNAQTINIDASKLLARSEVFFSPRSGSFVEGATFQVPIFVNTRGKSINGIEVRINFDKDKLMITNPAGGTSIIGIWVEPPGYDNTRGTASYVGVVPNGIITDAGLIGTITFKAKTTGRATVSVSSRSKILLNDGLGTETILDLGRAEYSLIAKAPEGVQIFSDTHPIQTNWYNNNNPIISWIKDPGVSGFSYIVDNKPSTIPDNTVDTEDTIKSFEKVNDGLLYFHIKAIKNGVWGTTGHFLVRVDTVPPAEFKPEANYLLAATLFNERTLISFFTTDNLSGVDHYEVGIIDKSQPPTESPVFIESSSPFQVPLSSKDRLQVIVRAVDKAGNIRDESIDVRSPNLVSNFIRNYIVHILLGILILSILIFIFYYAYGHHIIRHAKRALQIIKREDAEEILAEGGNTLNDTIQREKDNL